MFKKSHPLQSKSEIILRNIVVIIMIINNRTLMDIEDKDIDENGVCIIPEGIEIIDYIENERIKKLVIPEGVKIIDYIECSNLEHIELPSSLEMIKTISSGKLTLENIKFGNKTFVSFFDYTQFVLLK